MVGFVDGSCLFQPIEHGVLLGLSQLGICLSDLFAVNVLAFEGGRAVREHRGGMGEWEGSD